MSDMLEDVALAIYREDLNQPEAKRIPGILRNYNERMADRAIAAAEPHLRRKHRQELLDELEDRARADGLWTIRNRSPRKASPLSQWFWQFREEDE